MSSNAASAETRASPQETSRPAAKVYIHSENRMKHEVAAGAVVSIPVRGRAVAGMLVNAPAVAVHLVKMKHLEWVTEYADRAWQLQ
jgi:hypothetical protein